MMPNPLPVLATMALVAWALAPGCKQEDEPLPPPKGKVYSGTGSPGGEIPTNPINEGAPGNTNPPATPTTQSTSDGGEPDASGDGGTAPNLPGPDGTWTPLLDSEFTSPADLFDWDTNEYVEVKNGLLRVMPNAPGPGRLTGNAPSTYRQYWLIAALAGLQSGARADFTLQDITGQPVMGGALFANETEFVIGYDQGNASEFPTGIALQASTVYLNILRTEESVDVFLSDSGGKRLSGVNRPAFLQPSGTLTLIALLKGNGLEMDALALYGSGFAAPE